MANVFGNVLGSGISSTVFGWMSSLLFWIVVIVGLAIILYIAIVVRKNRNFTIPLIEVVPLGVKKAGFNTSTKKMFGKKPLLAGWFGKKKILFGMIDVGKDKELVANDGRKVQQGSTLDFNDINQQKGIVVMRKPDDPLILIPVKYIYIDKASQSALMEIAPSDYRDASIEILDQNIKELKSNWDKIAPIVIGGIMVILLFVVILFIIQYSKWSITEAKDMVLQASKDITSTLASVGNQIATRPGGSP